MLGCRLLGAHDHAHACPPTRVPLAPPRSYATKTCSNLRLWDALPTQEFDLGAFNEGAYERAVHQKRKADDITAVRRCADAAAACAAAACAAASAAGAPAAAAGPVAAAACCSACGPERASLVCQERLPTAAPRPQVLYPNDATEEGKELRLKQQFFFVSASLQDTIARYLVRPLRGRARGLEYCRLC